jgi:tight adherence protein C
MDRILILLRDYFPDPEWVQVVFLIVVGAAVFSLALSILYLLGTLFDPLQSRLRKMTKEGSDQKTLLTSATEALRPVTQLVEPGQESEQSRLRLKLAHAGFRAANSVSVFYAIKTLAFVATPLLVFVGGLFFSQLKPGELTYLVALSAAIGFMLPNLVLGHLIKRYQRRLRNGFPDALDMLVVCSEAGLGLKAAIQRVANELVVSHEELARDLELVNVEMRAGVDNMTALKNLVERTGLAEVRGLVVMLGQSMRFGTSIAETLRVYSEDFRDKRMQAAEEQAAKISIKLLFPLALCFLPAFLIVGVGPAILGAMAVFR